MAKESTALHETQLQGVDSEIAAIGPRDRFALDDQGAAGDLPDVVEALGTYNPSETVDHGKS